MAGVEHYTYLMISQNLNAPLNASISTPHNAVHFANKPNVTISYIIELRYVRSQWTSALYRAQRFPVERSPHTQTGRLSRPREISWPAYFSLGEGLAWFTCTNQA
jgi:hypothetical protein